MSSMVDDGCSWMVRVVLIFSLQTFPDFCLMLKVMVWVPTESWSFSNFM